MAAVPTPPAVSLSPSPDRLVRAVSRAQAIRVVVAVTTELCRTAQARHQPSPAVACALGRGLTSGLLLATLTTGGERVTLQLTCDGPIGALTVDAYDDGDVRGFASRKEAGAELPVDRRQRLEPLLSHSGYLGVIRDIGERDRYQGQIHLSTGEVDEDVEAYLRLSEQLPSALGCEVLMDADGRVRGAAGFLAQVLPGGAEEHIREAQHALRSGRLYEALAADPGLTPEAVVQAVVPRLAVEHLDTRPVRFRCRCSLQRIEAMLAAMDRQHLDEMIEEGKAEVRCDYCAEQYVIPAEDLLRLRGSAGSN